MSEFFNQTVSIKNIISVLVPLLITGVGLYITTLNRIKEIELNQNFYEKTLQQYNNSGYDDRQEIKAGILSIQNELTNIKIILARKKDISER